MFSFLLRAEVKEKEQKHSAKVNIKQEDICIVILFFDAFCFDFYFYYLFKIFSILRCLHSITSTGILSIFTLGPVR